MSAESLFLAARNLAIVAVVFLLIQGWWAMTRQRQLARRQVDARLNKKTDTGDVQEEARIEGGRYERLLMKAGVSLNQSSIMFAILVVAAMTLLTLILVGPLFAALIPLAAVLLLGLIWKFRYERRRRAIFESLPSIIDDVIRGIDAGRSLEQALVDSFKDAPKVFDALSFRLRSAVESGRDYTHLMDDFAELYQVPPLVFVAVALRTSSRFGSAIRPVLKQTSRALRSQQEMRREFMAATAETRFTAMVFAILPPGIGVALIAMNRGFREVLLHTETGHIMLAVSAGLILIAVAIIFRMVQGVGRG